MSPDNAAIETVEKPFSEMTDRELAEYNAAILTDIVTKVNGIFEQVQPMMDKISKNPMLGMLFR